jgi:tRNA(Ile)-lysidine synthase
MGNAPGEGLSGLNRIATGHTLDDQAETVLMRLIRGTGTRGLAGIHSRLVMGREQDNEPSGEVIRPLLGVRHQQLQQYLRHLKQPWREDSTNRDAHFTRNRVRQVLVPLLEREFNRAVVAGIGELAEIAREEEDYWENEASGWMGTGVHWTEPEWSSRPGQLGAQGLVELKPSPDLARPLRPPGPRPVNASVDLAWFLSEPVAVQRRIIRLLANLAKLPLEFRHVAEIREFAARERAPGKHLALPLGWKLIREPEALLFQTPDLRIPERTSENYEYSLPLPGRAMVPEAGIVVEAVPVVRPVLTWCTGCTRCTRQ